MCKGGPEESGVDSRARVVCEGGQWGISLAEERNGGGSQVKQVNDDRVEPRYARQVKARKGCC